jgi:predicted ATPase/transcriptional regulator with XRE-family HTH domain
MEQQYSFGYWLRLKRKALDLTREALADRVGCSAATIRKLEAEERRPSAQIAGLLAEIFGIPIEERPSFLSFARGDLGAAPVNITAVAPWSSSGAPARTNLPAPPTAIIGRAVEIALIRDYLLSADTRLVTLIGPPGIGKTRLSLEIAHGSRDHFPDGIFFVTLAPLDDPALIAPTIVQALGFVEGKNQSQLERLKVGLRDKQLLLVLDNLEHLISGVAPLVSDLLLACPWLKILTTSREALRVPGEWLYPVPVLGFPKELQLQSFDAGAISRFPALTLFDERARAVRPDFALNRDNFEAVATICGRLDGLPLAIELIAARLRLMSPHALLLHLSDQLALHADGMRSVPDRQKTLHNAIGWSYALLSEDEKRLFVNLSVFLGGFTLEAAEQTFSQSAFHKSVTDLIASLLDKSLLQRTIDAQGEPRFSMLITIQQFAIQRLREWGEETAARDMHLEFFLELAEQADQNIHGPAQVAWIDRLEEEQDNFRAALEWCVTKKDTQAALRLLGALGWPWWLRGRSNEVRAWFDKIIALPGFTQYPANYARLLNQLGRQSWLLGDYSDARSVLEQGRAIWLELGVEGERGLAEALNYLGTIEQSFGDDSTALSFFEQSFELCQKNDHPWEKALVMFNLAWVADEQDRTVSAFSWCQKSLDLFRLLGDGWGIARSSQVLGRLFLKQGNYDKARLFFEQELKLSEEHHFYPGIAAALTSLGNLFRLQGDYGQAERFYQKSLLMSHEHDLKWEISHGLFELGLLAMQQNNYRLAGQRFIESYESIYPIGDVKIYAYELFIGMASVAAGTHQPGRAARLSGAIKAIQDTTHYQFLPFDQAEIDRHIRLAREQLGDVAFEALAAQGRAMSLEQAIACALENYPRP